MISEFVSSVFAMALRLSKLLQGGLFRPAARLPFMVFLLVPAYVLAAAVTAEQCVILDDFSSSSPNSFPTGWTPREPSGKAAYTVMKEGDRFFLRARGSGDKSQGNGVEADRQVKWDLKEYPVLRWRWRPGVFPQGANEHTGKDDSVLGVYIGFCPPQDVQLCEKSVKGQLSLSDRLSMTRMLFSSGAGSLKYIWSLDLPKGFEFERARKQVKVLESGAPANRDQWVDERVDVAADYRRRFGTQTVLDPVGISILTDSDDTGSTAEGDYADFRICRQ